MSISCIVRYLIAAMLKPSLCDAALRRSWRTRNQKATQKKATTVLRSVILGFFVSDFDEKRSFLGFLSVKNSRFQLCCVYFFLPIGALLKPTLCITLQSENGRRQKATQKKATTVLRSSILGIFWKALLRIFQIFGRFCSSGGGGAALFPCESAQNLPPGAINVILNSWVKTFHQISSLFVKCVEKLRFFVIFNKRWWNLMTCLFSKIPFFWFFLWAGGVCFITTACAIFCWVRTTWAIMSRSSSVNIRIRKTPILGYLYFINSPSTQFSYPSL